MVVLWNPAAGSRSGLPTSATSRDELAELLRRYGLPEHLVETASEADLVAATRRAIADGTEVVVAAGGDGTVGTVAAELLDSGVALGILPLGSFMNVARSLGIPRDLEEAAAILAGGVVRAVDVGYAGDQLFLECASIGVNALLFRAGQRIDRGDFGAIVDAMRVLIRYRRAHLRLELDEGVVETRALMVAVANGPYAALGMTMAPDARLDDGRFDVRVYSGFTRWQVLTHLASVVLGRKVRSHEVRTYRSAAVRVTASRPVAVHADAHDVGTTPITLSTRAHALLVVTARDVETLDQHPDAETPPDGPAAFVLTAEREAR